MLHRIREEVAKGESFAFETTLANRSYAHRSSAGTNGFDFARPLVTTTALEAFNQLMRDARALIGLWLESQSRGSLQGADHAWVLYTSPRPSRSC